MICLFSLYKRDVKNLYASLYVMQLFCEYKLNYYNICLTLFYANVGLYIYYSRVYFAVFYFTKTLLIYSLSYLRDDHFISDDLYALMPQDTFGSSSHNSSGFTPSLPPRTSSTVTQQADPMSSTNCSDEVSKSSIDTILDMYWKGW